MKALHQFVSGYSKGDAISNEARYMRTLFRAWGYDSEIFCEAGRILPEFRKDVRDIHSYNPTADAVVLLHLSIGSLVNDVFASIPGKKAILYHNITPHHYFAAMQPQTAQFLKWGREQMRHLAGTANVNMAVSQYNAIELEENGYRDVRILPIVLDFEHLHVKPDRSIFRHYEDGRTNILFVGRCAPNKRIDDLVMTFEHYHKHIDTNSRLLLVGSYAGTESYYGLVRTLARNHGLSEHVLFKGSATQAELIAFYQLADLFLCTSEHEGFCIPLVEAMHFHLPVLAYDAGAIAETLDGAGVLYREKKMAEVAEMMHRMMTDTALRSAVIAKQDERLKRYQDQNLEELLRSHLAPLL